MTGTWPSGWATGDLTLAAQYSKGMGCIFDSTLGIAAANVDVTPIVGTYAHLLVVTYARSSAALTGAFVNIQFNGDTAANYDRQQLNGSATTVVTSEQFAQTAMFTGAMPANTAGANLFGVTLTFIPHYAGSANNKIGLSMSSTKIGTASTNLQTYLAAGFWRSNAAITRVNLIPTTGNFMAGTRVSVYGIGA